MTMILPPNTQLLNWKELQDRFLQYTVERKALGGKLSRFNFFETPDVRGAIEALRTNTFQKFVPQDIQRISDASTYRCHDIGNRLLTYVRDNGKCQICGCETNLVAIGRTYGIQDRKKPQAIFKKKMNTSIQFIHVLPSGHHLMMTIDHVNPKAKGGKNGLDNTQTACSWCNRNKSDSIHYTPVPMPMTYPDLYI